jgi:hypothetical protein
MALSALTAPAQADDAKALLAKAQGLYQKRGDALQNSVDAVTTLKQAAAAAQDQDLKYDILVLEARALYWQGMHTSGDDNKKVIFLAGQQAGDAAVALNDSYAEGHYYAGINLARWAEANGIVASISHKGELIAYMNKAADVTRTTRDGSNGETVDGYGPDRVLGRMYQKLPRILGGDHNLSVTYLRKTVANAGNLALNVVYLADTLIKGNSSEQAEGKQVATKLVSNDVNTFGRGLEQCSDPSSNAVSCDRTPETIEEFQMARDLLNGHPVP